MKKTKKRTRLLSRKRSAVRQIAITLAALFLLNYVMHIGVPLPRLAYHKLEERAGTGWTRVVKRDWAPEIRKTHIVYLSGDDTATVFGSVDFTIYGWMPGFGVSLDCTKDAPLYAGRSFMHKDETACWYFFGRVDDPAIETVSISLCSEEYDNMSHAYIGKEIRQVPAEMINRGGHRYFFLQDDGEWDESYSTPRSIVIGYDSAGNEVIRLEIEEGNASYFG